VEIKRHELKNLSMMERNLERFESTRVLRMLSFLEEVPDNLGSAYRDVLGHANRAIVLGKPKELIVEYLFLALQLGVAYFVSALDLPVDYSITFRGKNYPYGRKRCRAYVGPNSWSKLFYLGAILRVDKALAILKKIPTSVMRESEVIGNEVDFLIVDFLQGLFTKDLGGKTIGDLLVDAMDATDPEKLPERRHDYILNIKVPELNLYTFQLSDDEEGFNSHLAQGLDWHQYFWSHPDRAYDPEGWISLPLLAASTLAFHNKNFRIAHNSDYLPLWLVYGEF